VTSSLHERPERRRGAPIVEPRPAATLVVLRPRSGRLEVLLTQRAPHLRFGADKWVFPGGRVDDTDADHRAAAARETAEETGIEVDPGTLIPLTRWVTPPGLPARFDARFFAALAPPAAEVRVASPEVAASAWLTPEAALEAHARGELAMWLPTFVTLQQLAGAAPSDAIEARFRPGSGARLAIGPEQGGLRRLAQPWAGGIEGRGATGWIVGRRAWVVVDPADPTGETADAVARAASEAGAVLVGVAIRDLRPERHAGVEMFAAGLGLPVVGGPGSAAAPYPVTELEAGAPVPFGDVPLAARAVASRPAAERRWPGIVEFDGPTGPLEL
jgi:8-oxo-dGTP pyrophosphatase MutT (NUDIX family)